MCKNTDTMSAAEVTTICDRVASREETNFIGHFEAESVAELTEPEDKSLEAARLWTRAQTDPKLRASLMAWETMQFWAAHLRRGEDTALDLTDADRADMDAVLRLHAQFAASNVGAGRREIRDGAKWRHREAFANQFRDMLPDDFGDPVTAEGDGAVATRHESDVWTKAAQEYEAEKTPIYAFLAAAHAQVENSVMTEGEDALTVRFNDLPGLHRRVEVSDGELARFLASLLYGEEFAESKNEGLFYDGFIAARSLITAQQVPGVWDAFLALAVAADDAQKKGGEA